MATKHKSSGLPPVTPKFASALRLGQAEWDKLLQGLGRAPNEIECLIFSQLWSEEYCRKSTIGLTRDFQKLESPSIAESLGRFRLVDIGDGYFATATICENNLQTCIDPMLAAENSFVTAQSELVSAGIQPIGVLDVLRVGTLEHIRNHIRLRALLTGISRGGLLSGIPIVGGEIYFHPQFDSHSLCNIVCLGVVNRNDVSQERKGEKAERQKAQYGQLLVIIGAKTGYDAFPKELPDFEGGKPPSHAARRAVKPKISDTFFSRQLSDALLQANARDLLVDLVALDTAGFAGATLELAVRNSKGMRFDLDRPTVTSGQFTPRGILISETPQRFLGIIDREKLRQLGDYLSQFMLSAEPVGEVIDTDNVHFTWKHKEVAMVPYTFAYSSFVEKKFELSPNPPMLVKQKSGAEESSKGERKVLRKASEDDWSKLRSALSPESGQKGAKAAVKDSNLSDRWVDLLASPNICSKALIVEEFDQNVGANTVLACGADAAVLRIRKQKTKGKKPEQEFGLVVSVDSCGGFSAVDPYLGTLHAVGEALRNLAAVGARPIGASWCLNFGDTTEMEIIFQMAEVARAARVACDTWGIPVLSDRVSVGSTTDMGNVLPTPVLALLGKISDCSKTCRQYFQERGDKIFLLGISREEIEGSEYSSYCLKKASTEVPEFDFDVERAVCNLVVQLIEKGVLRSCHDLSAGGLAVALTESSVQRSKAIGAQLELENPASASAEALLFGETSSRFLVSCRPEDEAEVLEDIRDAGIPITGAGVVGGNALAVSGAVLCSIPVSTASRIWHGALNHVFGVRQEE